MFFVFSKILYFTLQPTSWIVGGILYAFFTKNPQKKVRILRGVFFLGIFLTSPLISNRIFSHWEYPQVAAESLRDTFDIGILLGGFTNSDFNGIDSRLHFAEGSANRFTDTYWLYKRGIIKKILITGGDGNLYVEGRPEADLCLTYLLQLGVPQSDIIIENASRNTQENALFTKKVLDSLGLSQSKLLLLTSAFHMERSIGCFKKVGLNTTPFPTSFLAKRLTREPKTWLAPDPFLLRYWSFFLKERVGILVYRLKGYV